MHQWSPVQSKNVVWAPVESYETARFCESELVRAGEMSQLDASSSQDVVWCELCIVEQQSSLVK